MKDKSFISFLMPKTIQQKENETISKEEGVNGEKQQPAKIVYMYRKTKPIEKQGKVVPLFT